MIDGEHLRRRYNLQCDTGLDEISIKKYGWKVPYKVKVIDTLLLLFYHSIEVLYVIGGVPGPRTTRVRQTDTPDTRKKRRRVY